MADAHSPSFSCGFWDLNSGPQVFESSCCDKNLKASWGGVIYFILHVMVHHQGKPRQALEAITMEVGWLLPCSPWLAQFPSLYSYCSSAAEAWAILHQLAIKKTLIDTPTGQSDGGSFSVKVPCFQMCQGDNKANQDIRFRQQMHLHTCLTSPAPGLLYLPETLAHGPWDTSR